MNVLAILLSALILSAAAEAETMSANKKPASSNPKFLALCDQFVKDSLALSPVSASQAGYHKHAREAGKILELDAELDDVSAAAFEHQRQVAERAVFQRVGEFDSVADQLVALRRQKHDTAMREYAARFPVPGDLVGGKEIAFAVHSHRARGRYNLGSIVVGDLIGRELDHLVRRRRCGLRRGRHGLRLNASRYCHQQRER